MVCFRPAPVRYPESPHPHASTWARKPKPYTRYCATPFPKPACAHGFTLPLACRCSATRPHPSPPAPNTGQHLHTLNYHSDYVTCLATSATRNLVVSGGLRAEIFLLHIEVRVCAREGGPLLTHLRVCVGRGGAEGHGLGCGSVQGVLLHI